MSEGTASALKEALPTAHGMGYGILPQYHHGFKPYKCHQKLKDKLLDMLSDKGRCLKLPQNRERRSKF